MNKMKIKKSDKNIFKGMGFTDIKAKELQFRSFLITKLGKYIKEKKKTQVEIAKELGITQSKVSNLMHGRIDVFSTVMLLNLFEKFGFNVYENIEGNEQIIFTNKKEYLEDE